MAGNIPSRILWAVEVLDVQPSDVILEIGCGRGFAIRPIVGKLQAGRVVAIDRSEKMIAAARAANTDALALGKVSLHQRELLHSGLDDNAFDKIFLFNLNVFWMDPVDELREIRRLLKASGLFYIFHQPPPGNDAREFADTFKANLEKNRFTVTRVLFESDENLTCLTSRPI